MQHFETWATKLVLRMLALIKPYNTWDVQYCDLSNLVYVQYKRKGEQSRDYGRRFRFSW